MNRNQKIAIGCGGAGCLGLLVVAVAAAGLYFFYERRPPMTNRNSNFNINSSSNRSSNSNTSTDSSDETSPSSSLSDDDKHKLFQAANAANDIDLMQKAFRRIGLFNSENSPTDAYSDFVREHVGWLLSNSDFVRTVDTPDKARAYLNAHIDD